MSRRLRGTRDLVFDGVEVITGLVEKTHREVSERWLRRVAITPAAPVVPVIEAIERGSAGLTYGSIRGVNRVVAALVRGASDPFFGDAEDLVAGEVGSSAWVFTQLAGVVNGAIGDHLEQRDNGLDLGMSLWREGRRVTPRGLPRSPRRLAVFVHGLAATEWCWSMHSERYAGEAKRSYGARLEDDFGYLSLEVRYNSGRRIAESGLRLAEILEALLAANAGAVERIVLVGHSMGGLVARSAALAGKRRGHAWVERLTDLFCIGSPHDGAPLEGLTHGLTRALGLVPAAATSVIASVLDARSAGIRDLRDGTITEEDPDDAEALARLLPQVSSYALVATITRDPEHPAGRWLGDLLVTPASAAGRGRRIPFCTEEVFPGMTHLDLVHHPEVYAMIRRAFETSHSA